MYIYIIFVYIFLKFPSALGFSAARTLQGVAAAWPAWLENTTPAHVSDLEPALEPHVARNGC